MASKDSLADVNLRFVAKGETLPAVKLPDGSTVQTGTVGALIQNIKLYDRISAWEEVEGASQTQLESMMEVAIPTLAKVGMLDLFPVEEWIASKSDGRKFVGRKAKELGY